MKNNADEWDRFVEELNALPIRSIVMDGSGDLWRKTVTGLWDCLGASWDQPSEESRTVLWQSASPSFTLLWKP